MTIDLPIFCLSMAIIIAWSSFGRTDLLIAMRAHLRHDLDAMEAWRHPARVVVTIVELAGLASVVWAPVLATGTIGLWRAAALLAIHIGVAVLLLRSIWTGSEIFAAVERRNGSGILQPDQRRPLP